MLKSVIFRNNSKKFPKFMISPEGNIYLVNKNPDEKYNLVVVSESENVRFLRPVGTFLMLKYYHLAF